MSEHCHKDHNEEHNHKHHHDHGACHCHDHHEHHEEGLKKPLIKIGITAILLGLTYVLTLNNWFLLALCLIAYATIGYDVIINAVKNIIHGEVFDEMFLMGLATIGAFAIGDYQEAVAIMFFFKIGNLFEEIAEGKSKKSIEQMMDIRPDYANLKVENEFKKVSPHEVKVGDIIQVKPGEKIPVDGVIIDGTTTVNTAALTGESLPIDKEISDQVISGSINLNGLIQVRATSSFEQSTVSKIIELVQTSSSKKAKSEKFITKFSRVYTPIVVISALILAFLPPLLLSQSLSIWVKRALIFLVVSCPCALVVSVPLSFFGGIGGASKKGILIKGASYVEALSQIKALVFDKTGTITQGSFSVTAIHPQTVSKEELLDLAATAESYSTHPIALSILKAHEKHIDQSRIKEIKEISGMGLCAIIDDKTIYVGNSKLMKSINSSYHDCHHVGTIIHLSKEDEYLGHIVISDTLKPNAKDSIKKLKELGISKTIMLTGDSEKVGQSIGEAVGLDEIHANLLPTDKVNLLEQIIKENHKKGLVSFVGDGINDAPALIRSDIGIAMGALGSDAAIEAADVVLMDDQLSKIESAIKISKYTMRIVKQNIVFAITAKILILILGALGLVGLPIAIFGDVGVLILAVLNAMRALRSK